MHPLRSDWTLLELRCHGSVARQQMALREPSPHFNLLWSMRFIRSVQLTLWPLLFCGWCNAGGRQEAIAMSSDSLWRSQISSKSYNENLNFCLFSLRNIPAAHLAWSSGQYLIRRKNGRVLVRVVSTFFPSYQVCHLYNCSQRRAFSLQWDLEGWI